MEILHFNEDSLKESLQSKKKVLVDFFATWCGPCKMLSPILEEIRNEIGDDIIIGKVDVDENFDLARSYGIMSVPTLLLFVGGEESKRIIGLKSKQDILNTLSPQRQT